MLFRHHRHRRQPVRRVEEQEDGLLGSFNQVAFMDTGVAFEVVGNGLRRDVLERDAVLGQRLLVGLERTEVAREHGLALFRQQARHADEQLHMVALHVHVRLPMALELENVGGSTNTRSKRRPVRRASVTHAIVSPRSKVCCSPSKPLAAILRAAQSR